LWYNMWTDEWRHAKLDPAQAKTKNPKPWCHTSPKISEKPNHSSPMRYW
jgi:hypothetical protein